ncbi:ABC transporter permease subunit [Chloroflexota bacterium]
MRRAFVVWKREWAETIKNKTLMLMMTLMPMIMVGAPFLYISIILRLVKDPTVSEGGFFQRAIDSFVSANPNMATLESFELFQIILFKQGVFFLLMITIMVGMSIATFGIIGEKQNRSLEPLLASPVKTWELLVGKVLAAAVPALVMTWLCSLLYMGGVYAYNAELFPLIVDSTWIIIMLFISPAVALLSLGLGVIISSRSNDPRSAQNWGVFLILPVLFIIIGPIVGTFPISLTSLLVIAFVFTALTIAVFYFGVKIFNRDAILTKWR